MKDQNGIKNHHYKHGLSNSPTYNTWHLMIQRCHNRKAPDYYRYGGRGIKVCPRWKASFINFTQDMGLRPTGSTLDRIDNDAGYNKENCRWLQSRLQHRNTRRNKWITYRGETKTMIEWCEELGLKYTVIKQRLRPGRIDPWTVERAFETPAQKKTRRHLS